MATLMAGHRKMEESKQVRDDPSTSQALKTHQGRAQGADQAPLAAIARVSAAKSETWILVLCLRMYSMKGVLTRGTNEETGSQVRDLLQRKTCVHPTGAWTVWRGQDTTEAGPPCVSAPGVCPEGRKERGHGEDPP